MDIYELVEKLKEKFGTEFKVEYGVILVDMTTLEPDSDGRWDVVDIRDAVRMLNE